MSGPTGVSLVAGQSFAGLGRRVGAQILDVIINLSIVFFVGVVIRVLRSTGAWTPAGGSDPRAMYAAVGPGARWAIFLAFIVATGPVYFILCHASPWQATFGKRLLKIYVTSNNGKRISMARSFARWLTFCVLGLFGASLVSLVTIAATSQQKAIHDFCAGTLVWRGQPQPGGSLEPWRIAACFGVPFVWITATFLLTL
jgi:uncharacterized RDD family membrane protein YckC